MGKYYLKKLVRIFNKWINLEVTKKALSFSVTSFAPIDRFAAVSALL